MPLEIEAKMPVESHDQVRERLRGLGAGIVMDVIEENVFFDRPTGELLAAGSGLRVRTNRDRQTGQTLKVEVTFKGARRAARLKTRPEIQFIADDAVAVTEMLNALGYARNLVFEKRRQRWKLDTCTVELDELPELGRFIEIEGPDEAAVLAAREKLGMADVDLVSTGYAEMIATHLHGQTPSRRELRF